MHQIYVAKSKPPSEGQNSQQRGVSPHIFELSRSLHEFAASSRYNLLKSLQVGRFIDRQTTDLGVIESFTFEKLIELGSKKLAKLQWLKPEQTETLVKVLNGLSENAPLESPVGDSPLVQPIPLRPVSDMDVADSEEVLEVDGVPLFTSVQGELKLREVLNSLSKHPRFSECSEKPLGTYWKASWPKAPFEEALTLRQLVEIDIATLLKKRTMSSRKVTTIVLALQNALTAVSGQNPEPVLTPVRTDPTPENSPVAIIKPFKRTSAWTTSLVRGGTSARAAVCLFERECDHARESFDPAWSWIARVPDVISADEFLQILEIMENCPRGDTLNCDNSVAIRKKLSEYLVERSLPILELFRVSIASVGTPITTLSEGLGKSALVSPAKEMAAYLLLFTLGAETVSLLDESLPGFWTTRPAAIHAIVEAVLQKLPLADNELDHLLSELLTPELVRPLGELLRGRLDSIDGRWVLTRQDV